MDKIKGDGQISSSFSVGGEEGAMMDGIKEVKPEDVRKFDAASFKDTPEGKENLGGMNDGDVENMNEKSVNNGNVRDSFVSVNEKVSSECGKNEIGYDFENKNIFHDRSVIDKKVEDKNQLPGDKICPGDKVLPKDEVSYNENENSNLTNDVVSNPGDTILGNLRNISDFYSTSVNKTVEVETNTIKTLGSEVAERIIASREALNAEKEVRVSLKDNVLPQTEIRIVKNEKTNSLAVDFYTSSDKSAVLLSMKQTDLRMYLNDKLTNFSDIEVNVYQNSAGDEHNDGRSRQEYVGEQPQQEEDS